MTGQQSPRSQQSLRLPDVTTPRPETTSSSPRTKRAHHTTTTTTSSSKEKRLGSAFFDGEQELVAGCLELHAQQHPAHVMALTARLTRRLLPTPLHDATLFAPPARLSTASGVARGGNWAGAVCWSQTAPSSKRTTCSLEDQGGDDGAATAEAGASPRASLLRLAFATGQSQFTSPPMPHAQQQPQQQRGAAALPAFDAEGRVAAVLYVERGGDTAQYGTHGTPNNSSPLDVVAATEPFQETELARLQPLLLNCGPALRNAVTRQQASLSASSFSAALLEARLDGPSTERLVCRQAMRACNCADAFLLQLDPRSGMLWRWWTPQPQQGAKAAGAEGAATTSGAAEASEPERRMLGDASGRSVASLVLRTNVPTRLEAVSSSHFFNLAVDCATFDAATGTPTRYPHQPRTLLAVPVRIGGGGGGGGGGSGGRVLGVLVALNRSNGVFTPTDEAALLSLATWVAPALSSCAHYEHAVGCIGQYHELLSFANVLSAQLGAFGVLTTLQEKLPQLLRCGGARVFLLEPLEGAMFVTKPADEAGVRSATFAREAHLEGLRKPTSRISACCASDATAAGTTAAKIGGEDGGGDDGDDGDDAMRHHKTWARYMDAIVPPREGAAAGGGGGDGGAGIATLVWRSGEVVNTRDAPRHPHFDPSVDLTAATRDALGLVQPRGGFGGGGSGGAPWAHCGKLPLLSMPCVSADGTMLAVLQLYAPEERRGFDAEDEHLLRLLARSAAVAISAALLYERSQDMFDDLITAASGLDLRSATEFITRRACEVISAERASMFIVDHEYDELILNVSADASGIRIPISKGVAGYVARTAQIANIPDAYACELFDQAVDRKTGFRTRNILCMPLFDEAQRVVAVVQVLNKHVESTTQTASAFSTNDEYFLSIFAAQASIALRVAQQQERILAEQRKCSLLQECAVQVCSEFSLPKIVDLVMVRLKHCVKADRVTFFLRDQDELVSIYASGEGGEQIHTLRLSISNGLAGHVARTGEVIDLKDAHLDERFDRSVDRATGYRTRNVVVVPVENQRGHVTGVIQVINKQSGRFDAEDITIVSCIAAQAGVAVENTNAVQDVFALGVAMGKHQEQEEKSLQQATPNDRWRATLDIMKTDGAVGDSMRHAMSGGASQMPERRSSDGVSSTSSFTRGAGRARRASVDSSLGGGSFTGGGSFAQRRRSMMAPSPQQAALQAQEEAERLKKSYERTRRSISATPAALAMGGGGISAGELLQHARDGDLASAQAAMQGTSFRRQGTRGAGGGGGTVAPPPSIAEAPAEAQGVSPLGDAPAVAQDHSEPDGGNQATASGLSTAGGAAAAAATTTTNAVVSRNTTDGSSRGEVDGSGAKTSPSRPSSPPPTKLSQATATAAAGAPVAAPRCLSATIQPETAVPPPKIVAPSSAVPEWVVAGERALATTDAGGDDGTYRGRPVYELPAELTARLKELMPELVSLEGFTLVAHL